MAFGDGPAGTTPIPLGSSDFEKLRNNGMHVIDKSTFIGKVLLTRSWDVFLFTRPRRFGKSTNLNMMDDFLNRKKSGTVINPDTGEAEDMFKGMRILGNENLCRTCRNRYPVIHLDFKDVSSMSFEGYLNGFGSVMSRLYADNTDVLDDSLDDSYVNRFLRIKNEDASETDLQDSIRFMTKLMHRKYDTRAVVLIDEYENSIHSLDGSKPADGNAFSDRDKAIMFLRRTLGSALKSNTHLKIGVLTGITEIVEHDLFSGLNNIYRNTVLTRDWGGRNYFGDCFGYTETEVRRMISDYGGDESDFKTACDWYDSYDFGLGRMFNPLSINSFVNAGFVPGPYWSETSTNRVLRNFSPCMNDQTVDILTGVLEGEEPSIARVERGLSYNRRPLTRDLITLMVHSGYLNAEPCGGMYVVRIPNREIQMTFGNEVLNMLYELAPDDGKCTFADDFRNALINGDAGELQKILTRIVDVCADPETLTSENALRMFVAGASTTMSDRYSIQTERMSGKGYSDLVLESRDGGSADILMEFKRRPKDSSTPLGVLAEEALRQTDDKGYALSLKGDVNRFGIAFEEKDIVVRGCSSAKR